jgi:hypothetical protein
MNWRENTGDKRLDEAIKATERKKHGLTVRDLCRPPRMHFLMERHEPSPATADHVDRAMQAAFLDMLEIGPRHTSAGLKEFIGNVGDHVPARVVIDDGVLKEYKRISTHARTRYFKALEEQPNVRIKNWDLIHPWIQEINLKAHLCRVDGRKIGRAEIIAVYKDWHRSMAERDPHYPAANTEILAVELLDRGTALDLFNYRVELFKACEKTKDEKLPLCTEKERWETPEKWEVWAKGGQKSSYIAETKHEAEYRIIRMTTGKQYEIRHVPPVPVRCKHHCMAAPFCSQYLDGKNG